VQRALGAALEPGQGLSRGHPAVVKALAELSNMEQVARAEAALAGASEARDGQALEEALAAASALGLSSAGSAAFHTASMALARLQGEASALGHLDLALASG
jgi:hypothetical protein